MMNDVRLGWPTSYTLLKTGVWFSKQLTARPLAQGYEPLCELSFSQRT